MYTLYGKRESKRLVKYQIIIEGEMAVEANRAANSRLTWLNY